MRRSILVIALLTASCSGPSPAAPQATPETQCSKESNAFRCLVGAPAYDEWEGELRLVETDVTSDEVAQSILALYTEYPDDYVHDGFIVPHGGSKTLLDATRKLEADDVGPLQNLEGARYYDVDAYHERTKTNEQPERKMGTSFDEGVQVVRVPLPETEQKAREIGSYNTKLGRVIIAPSLTSTYSLHGDPIKPWHHGKSVEPPYCERDHWYGSVEQLRNDWMDVAGTGTYPQVADIKRVDLVTTARVNGYRFAAIGFYLAYRQDDVTPAFYVIEAGQAMNYARQVYLSDGLADSNTAWGGPGIASGLSTYNPTHLSSTENHYKSLLSGAVKDSTWEPGQLEIRAFHKFASDAAESQYMKVTARFKHLDPPTSVMGPKHFNLLCRAGGRVRKIRRLAQPNYRALNKLENFFAKYCKDDRVYGLDNLPKKDGVEHQEVSPERSRCDDL